MDTLLMSRVLPVVCLEKNPSNQIWGPRAPKCCINYKFHFRNKKETLKIFVIKHKFLNVIEFTTITIDDFKL